LLEKKNKGGGGKKRKRRLPCYLAETQSLKLRGSERRGGRRFSRGSNFWGKKRKNEQERRAFGAVGLAVIQRVLGRGRNMGYFFIKKKGKEERLRRRRNRTKSEESINPWGKIGSHKEKPRKKVAPVFLQGE